MMFGIKEAKERKRKKIFPFTSANLSLINTGICLKNIFFTLYKRRNV